MEFRKLHGLEFKKIQNFYTDQYWNAPDLDNARERYLGTAGDYSLNFKDNVPLGFEEFGKPLLQLEMDAVQSRHSAYWGDRPKGEIVLVLLIGTSFDPLLQTVWFYQPKRILPVLNTYYNAPAGKDCYKPSREQWEDFKADLLRLPKKIVAEFENDTWLKNPYIPENLVKDDPASVFAFLHNKLKDNVSDNQELVIDITGAKKSMVAGAYFYAAYRGARISYVDFEIYDNEVGRPYGYTCDIREQSNPFQEFSLQIWEQIEGFYDEYNFSAAAALLADMNPDKFASLFVAIYPEKTEQEVQTFFINLLKYLEVCQDWERGALFEANKMSKTLGGLENCLILPTVINGIGTYWTTTSDSRLRFDFLTDHKAVVYYAEDELERAKWNAKVPKERQRDKDLQPDYRNAFSRAYAIHETILKSRVLLMFEHKKLQVGIPGPMQNSGELSIELIDDWHDWMVRFLESRHSLHILKGQTGKKYDYNRQVKAERRLKIPTAYSDCIMNPDVDLEMSEGDLKKLAIRRNEITHSYVHVTSELAQTAINLAESNLNHFRNVWLNKCLERQVIIKKTVVTVMPWAEVKEAFGLDFLVSPRSKGNRDE